jgi:CHRD domain
MPLTAPRGFACAPLNTLWMRGFAMKRWIGAVVAIGVLALSSAPVTDAAARPAQYTIALRPMGHSHVSGSARVVYNGKAHTTTVTVRLQGLSAGIHFAHIHIGSCGGNGDVRYALAPMQVGRSGTVTETTVVPAHLITSALHINVHGVPSHALQVVACGNL